MKFSQAAIGGFVVPLLYTRESEDTTSAFSQRIRCTAAVKRLKEDPQLEGIHITDIYPTIYPSKQVNRNDVLGSESLQAMMVALAEGLPKLPSTLENKQAEVWIITVSLLRYGKTRKQLKYITKVLQKLGNKNLKIRLMPLDAFGLPPDRVMNILVDYIEGVERIHRDICTNFDQGKNVAAEPSYVLDQQAVTSGAKEMKKRLMNENDDGLKEFVKRGTKLVTEANGNNPTTTTNETPAIVIKYHHGRDRFKQIYRESMKEIANCSNGDERKRLTKDRISTLKTYVTVCNDAQQLIGAYSRRSPGSRTAVLCDNVPASQMSYNFSCIEWNHNVKTIEDIDVALFVDDQKKRSASANDAYVTFLAAILARAFTEVYITLPARISQHSAAIELFCAACEESDVTYYFTMGLGKDIEELAKMEEEKHRLLREILEIYKKSIIRCRNEFLPCEASPGTITIRVSEFMSDIGSSKVTERMMAEFIAFDGNNDGQYKNNHRAGNDETNDDNNDYCEDDDSQDDDERSILSDWSIESDTESIERDTDED